MKASKYYNILDEIPSLWDKLPSESQAALSASCRQLQEFRHTVTKVITVNSNQDIISCKGPWPNLVLIISRRSCWSSEIVDILPNISLQLLAAIDWCQGDAKPTGLLVKPFQSNQASFRSDTASPFAHLHTSHWKRLTGIAIKHSNGNLPDIIQQLGKHAWPSLNFVGMMTNDVNHAAMRELVPGAWENLKHLSMKGQHTADVEAMLHSINKALPRLRILCLTGFQVNPACVAAAPCGVWKLHSLSLAAVEFNINDDLAHMQKMPDISLAMRRMTLINSNLHHAAGKLFQYSFHHLADLYLRSCTIDAHTIENLISCNLPVLALLEISGSPMDYGAMRSLSRGKWSKLAKLNLAGVPLNARKINLLLEGRWDSLRLLELDLTVAIPDIWQILSLPDIYFKNGQLVVNTTMSVERRRARLLPSLKKVCFKDTEGR